MILHMLNTYLQDRSYACSICIYADEPDFENLHSIWFQETKGDDDSEIPNPLASGYQQSVVNSSIDYSNIS